MVDSGLGEQFPGAWYAWWQVQDGFVLTMAVLLQETARTMS
jgi:hypothetical protein